MQKSVAEALSQSQIDELLNRMRSGDVEEPHVEEDKAKEYDFSSPKKFTKDQLKSLHTLYENFSRILAIYFTGVLHDICEIEVIQVEEQRYCEFNNALPDSTLIALIALETEGIDYDGATMMVQLQTNFGFALIDRLMGGLGATYAPDRDFTDIETSLIELVMKNITKHMTDTWNKFFAMNAILLSLETNGRMLQAYSQQDVVVIVSLEVKVENITSIINMCMPAENLEQVIDSFSVKYAHATKQQYPERDQQKRDILLDSIKDSDLTVEAVLNQFQMSLSDISALQPGDVIDLNKKIDSAINVNIENIPWCTAIMGEMNQNKALKLVDIRLK